MELSYAASITGNSGPQVGTLLGYRSGDGRSLHLSLVIDNHASVILEIDELTIFPSEGFPLPDHHSGHDFFPELWFTLRDECEC